MLLVLTMTFCGLPVFGQEQSAFPRAELFGTYSYFNIDGGDLIPRQSLNGWGAGYTANFNRWVGATVQILGGYGRLNESFRIQRTGVNVVSADIAAHGFLGGPELSYRGESYRLFAHALAGPVHYSLKNIAIGTGPIGIAVPGSGESETNFAWGAGTGLDMRITPNVSARLIQFDYIVERANPIRRHYRMAVGFVATIGGE